MASVINTVEVDCLDAIEYANAKILATKVTLDGVTPVVTTDDVNKKVVMVFNLSSYDVNTAAGA